MFSARVLGVISLLALFFAGGDAQGRPFSFCRRVSFARSTQRVVNRGLRFQKISLGGRELRPVENESLSPLLDFALSLAFVSDASRRSGLELVFFPPKRISSLLIPLKKHGRAPPFFA